LSSRLRFRAPSYQQDHWPWRLSGVRLTLFSRRHATVQPPDSFLCRRPQAINASFLLLSKQPTSWNHTRSLRSRSCTGAGLIRPRYPFANRCSPGSRRDGRIISSGAGRSIKSRSEAQPTGPRPYRLRADPFPNETIRHRQGPSFHLPKDPADFPYTPPSSATPRPPPPPILAPP